MELAWVWTLFSRKHGVIYHARIKTRRKYNERVLTWQPSKSCTGMTFPYR